MSFNNDKVSFDAEFLVDGDVRIVGKLNNTVSLENVRIFATRPIDRMTNYSGSGLPFPCADVAFENSPNNHTVDASGHFDVKFKYPNGYYMSDAREKVPPSIFFSITEQMKPPYLIQFKIPDPLPMRTLGYRPMRQGPMYYSAKQDLIPIAGAADTMMMYADAKYRFGIA